MVYYSAPHVIFPGMNVTRLLYLSVTDIAELYPVVEVGSASMRSIIIVWNCLGGEMIGCSNP